MTTQQKPAKSQKVSGAGYISDVDFVIVTINSGIVLIVFMLLQVTLGISALLSMTVFLMTIRESLPPTEKTPLISEYFGHIPPLLLS